ncbi:hypothetical protein A2160_01170 [Candidatus Beckwithbacteria bacterium RBG_13_42_9]|uniref:GIY-YIG domain-containing protein n=1 Tax=Candidatus Beckwithbacteria bacterium RBG_13_42_9 TaxID=1797457 RepID=A0A1F5E3S2_9BACT|nr:MAG: hypothetical protein A2160_01170 [Candidatus Beckwithbacteria bacterium RBG_13_42_9]
MFYVYVLYSLKDGKFYTGFSTDLKRRVREHSWGESQATKSRRPLILVYYEAYLIEKDARAREVYLKTSMGKRVIKKQLAHFLRIYSSDKIQTHMAG